MRRPAPQEALKALELGELRWQALLEAAPDAIISIDFRGRITLFNRSAERTFGYSAAEVIGRNVKLLMPQPFRREHDSYLAAYQRTAIPKAIGRIREVSAKRKNGEVFPIALSVSEAKLGDDVIYTAIIRDVSERVRSQEALRRQRDFADRLFESADVIVVVTDENAKILRLNSFMEETTGYSSFEAVNRELFELLMSEQERARCRKLYNEVLAGHPLRGVAWPIVTKAGSVRVVEWHVSAIEDKDGAMLGVLSLGHDITDRLAREREMAELRKLAQQRQRLADLGAITAQIVHEIGNPLTAVSMQAQLIRRRVKSDPEQPLADIARAAERIVLETGRLDSLVREFMGFAREQRLDLRATAVVSMLREVAAVWEPVAARLGIAIEIAESGRDIPIVQMDEEKIRRVLDNLVKNAIEAIDSDGGTISLRVLAVEGMLSIVVEDDGPGIPSDVQPFKLFETTKADGTGFGLAIARQIVLAHGGSLEYQARVPHGTSFDIRLPLRSGRTE